MKRLLYFGCIGTPGHFWFIKGEVSMPWDDQPTFPIDGEYTPAGNISQGSAREYILGEYRIIAWHDYTGDSRGNSNSALVGVDYSSKEEMLEDAKAAFPSVMSRQSAPLVFAEEGKRCEK